MHRGSLFSTSSLKIIFLIITIEQQVKKLLEFSKGNRYPVLAKTFTVAPRLPWPVFTCPQEPWTGPGLRTHKQGWRVRAHHGTWTSWMGSVIRQQDEHSRRPDSFSWGPHQPRSCLQRAEIILGLYKCNYSLTVKELKLRSALWRQLQGGHGPQWKWAWHPCSKGLGIFPGLFNQGEILPEHRRW